MDPITCTALISAATYAAFNETVKEIVKKFISPKLDSISQNLKQSKQLEPSVIEHVFEEYLLRSIERHRHITTLVFPNSQKELYHLYEPLYITNTTTKAIYIIDNKEIPEITDPGKRVLIQDDAGMGKTTLMRKLLLFCIENKLGLPVFVELRRLDKDKSVLDILMDELSSIDSVVDSDTVFKLLKRGDFIIFLDAIDEIQNDGRESILTQINSFINKVDKNTYIISSRPEESLACFPSFQGYTVNSLTNDQAYSLIRRYDNNQALGERLITALRDNKDESLFEYLNNPLLVSLLYKAYTYKQDIPLRKHLFYSQVFEALFNAHDLSKDGYRRINKSGLDLHDFQRVMRVFCYATYLMGMVEFDREKALDVLEKVKPEITGITYKPMDFFIDLIKNVPLLKKDGLQYQWSHRSIQEYFAAQYICYELKNDICETCQLLQEDFNRHKNLVDLCRSIDIKFFRQNFLRPAYEAVKIKIEQTINNNLDIPNISKYAALATMTPYVIAKHKHLPALPAEKGPKNKDHALFGQIKLLGRSIRAFTSDQNQVAHYTHSKHGDMHITAETRDAQSHLSLFSLDKTILATNSSIRKFSIMSEDNMETLFPDKILPLAYSPDTLQALYESNMIESTYQAISLVSFEPIIDYGKLIDDLHAIQHESKISINSIFGFSPKQLPNQ